MLPDRRFYLDSIFDDFIDNKNNFDIMKSDIYEENGKYHIDIDIPGFKKEDISIEYEAGYLTIIAEQNTENNDKKYLKRERFYGKTVRKFYVGDIDNEKIQAEFKNGILELIVPKEEKTTNKKIIEIK